MRKRRRATIQGFTGPGYPEPFPIGPGIGVDRSQTSGASPLLVDSPQECWRVGLDVRGRSLKRIVIVAGPDGAGKTAFAEQFLLKTNPRLDFINADLIARGLSPLAPNTTAFQAGRIMLSLIKANVRTGNRFAFETTLSGATYARLIPRWQSSGYKVSRLFLRLSRVEIALALAAETVTPCHVWKDGKVVDLNPKGRLRKPPPPRLTP